LTIFFRERYNAAVRPRPFVLPGCALFPLLLSAAFFPAPSPALGAPDSGSAASLEVPASEQDLRDSPNSAMRYSLWRGAGAPLMLPGAGLAPGTERPPLEYSGPPGERLGLGSEELPGYSDLPITDEAPGDSAEGLFVALDLDLSGSSGDFQEAVAEVAGRSGLRVDDRFPPCFSGEGRSRVTVRGWVDASRLGDVFGPGVEGVRVDRSAPARANPEGPWTEIIVGLRIPKGRSPSAALSESLRRLHGRSRLRLKRVVGYQTIPGTSRIVLVILGRVPVRGISRVLEDPGVVKILPSPDLEFEPAPEPPGVQALAGKFLSHAASRQPLLMLGTLIATALLAGTAFARSRK
jgi:hypothetical protein